MGRTMEEAPERLVRRLSQTTRAETDFLPRLTAMQAARAAEAQRAYAAAYQSGNAGPISRALSGQSAQTVEQIVQPLLSSYMARAAALTGERQGHLLRAIDIMTTGGGKTGMFGTQTLQNYVHARQSLDRMMNDLRRSARAGNAVDADALRIIGEMRKRMNTIVHRNYPLLRQADNRFASDLAREEAMDLGRQYALRLGQRQDDIIKEMRNLEMRSPPAIREQLREHMMQGIMRTLADEIGTAGGIPTRMIQPLTGGIRPAPREALENVLAAPIPGTMPAGRAGRVPPHAPGQQMVDDVMGVLNDEARTRKIFTDVFGNSNTAAKMAAQSDMRELPRIAAELATGGVFSGIRRAVAERLTTAITERNNEQLARIITETDPRVLYLALQDMQRMLPGMRGSERGLTALSAALASAAGQQVTGP
jgi:hypothetical protein